MVSKNNVAFTYRRSHFRVRRVLVKELHLNNGLLLNVTDSKDIVDSLELLDVKERVEGVQLAELLQIALRVGRGRAGGQCLT